MELRLEGKRIMRALVADDDRVGATMLARSLNRWGLDVTVAADGGERYMSLPWFMP